MAKKAEQKAKKPKTPKEKTYVAVVLDRSGSMDSIRKEALDAFNDQVKAVQEKAKGMDASVCMSTFSDVADPPKVWMKDAAELRPMAFEEYVPHGMTAMYDAVCDAVDGLKKAPDAEEARVAFLVVIISDGQENNSKRFKAEDVAERVKACEATGRWTFTYLGANQDLAEVSRHLGIRVGNMAAFVATPDGVNCAAAMNVRATTDYMDLRSKGVKSSASFYSSAGGGVDKPAGVR